MRSLYLAALLAFISAFAFSQRKMVGIGSSTTAGQGSFPLDSSWMNRFNHYYKYEFGILDSTYNLGVGGYSCYKGMPTGYVPPPNRPGPDIAKNVSQAVAYLSSVIIPANGVIIVNYPTNGYDTFSVAEVMISLQVIYDSAVKKGYKCFITTTQPRSDAANHFNTSAAKRKLAVIKDSILNRFGGNTLNFWDGMFNPADTTILLKYSAGDSIHFNNAGHRELFNRVVAKNVFNIDPLPMRFEQFNASLQNKQVLLRWSAQINDPQSSFIVQRSSDGTIFTPLRQMNDNPASGKQQYQYTDLDPLPGLNYYRLEINEPGRSHFSTIITVRNGTGSLVIKRLYPVPSTQVIHLDIISAQRQTITLDIINSAGLRLQQFTRTLTREETIITLPVYKLASGSYFLRISYPGSEPVIQAFIK